MQKILTILSRHKIAFISTLVILLVACGSAAAYIGVLHQQVAEDKAGSSDATPQKAPESKTKPIAKSAAPSNRAETDTTTAAGTDNPTARPSSPTSNSPRQAPATAATNNSTGVKTPSTGPSTGANSNPPISTPTPPTTPVPQCPAGYSGTHPNCVAPPPSPIGIGGSWRLIMQDEFNGSSLNTAMWAPQRGPSYSYGDPYNPQYEDAYYVANNPKVQNGSLVLTLNQGSTNGYPYSSGMVQNGRNFNYKYGYTEARIKVPGNTGVWPAYWTLPAPVDQSWPPEIDIFEFGLSSQTRPSFNYHYGSSSNHQQSGLTLYGSPSVNYTQDYHVYGMLWTPTKIQVYIDGAPGPSYTNSANITSIPQYLILNLGLKKGAVVPSGTAMYIDYVRVWQ